MTTFANKNEVMENFEEPLGDERRRLLEQELRNDLHQFLLSMKRGLQRLCRLPAPTLPVWSRHAVESYGISHDEDELK